MTGVGYRRAHISTTSAPLELESPDKQRGVRWGAPLAGSARRSRGSWWAEPGVGCSGIVSAKRDGGYYGVWFILAYNPNRCDDDTHHRSKNMVLKLRHDLHHCNRWTNEYDRRSPLVSYRDFLSFMKYHKLIEDPTDWKGCLRTFLSGCRGKPRVMIKVRVPFLDIGKFVVEDHTSEESSLRGLAPVLGASQVTLYGCPEAICAIQGHSRTRPLTDEEKYDLGFVRVTHMQVPILEHGTTFNNAKNIQRV